jgi:hypothetical protein
MDGPSPKRRTSVGSHSDDPEFIERVRRSRSEDDYATSSSEEEDKTPKVPRVRQGFSSPWTDIYSDESKPVPAARASLPNSLGRTPDTPSPNQLAATPSSSSFQSDDASGATGTGLVTTNPTMRAGRHGAGSSSDEKKSGMAKALPSRARTTKRHDHGRRQSHSVTPSMWPKGSGVSSCSEVESLREEDGEGMQRGTRAGPPLPAIPSVPEFSTSSATDDPVGNLFRAAEIGDYPEIQRIIIRGWPDVHTQRPQDQRTPMMMAIARKYEEVPLLLMKHATREQLQLKDSDENTALMIAIIHGNYRVLKHLIRHAQPADLQIRNRSGSNALLLALDHGQILIARRLLAAGADVPNDKGQHALLAAIEAQRELRIRVLIKAGAMINQVGPKNLTPLSLAIRKDDAVLVSELLEKGAHPNEDDPDYDAPLAIAARYGNGAITARLLKYGARAGRVNKVGIAALHIAAKNGHLNVVERLIEAGADPSVQDNFGHMPLHAAVYYGHVDVAQMLLQHGAAVDVADKRGCTPLHYAARYGGGDCCKLLLGLGADPYATDKAGTPVLAKARMSDDPECYTAVLLAQRQRAGGRRGCAIV